ncbi:MAG TPA: ABC transporter permease [Acidimicrobiales bacterium]|nr:ABC transporter permease [Acidimicrobiales bacterium]
MNNADGGVRVLDLDGRPTPWRAWWADLWQHRDVLAMLARADFHVRYKRAAFGVIWAVVVPLLQGIVLAVVFSRIIRVGRGPDFGAYVMSGVLAWNYFTQTLANGSTAVVEGRNLTDKVWFPRAMLPIVPALANIVGLTVSMAVLVVVAPLLGAHLGVRVLLLPVAMLLLITFTVALSLCLSALHVYFRDVRFLVQATLLIWLYVTPIAYPAKLLGQLAPYLDFNPMTGVVDVFRLAIVGPQPNQVRAITVTLVFTIALVFIAVEAFRRHDRLFVDRL